MSHQAREYTGLELAVVGLAGRFPGAPDIDAYWRVIRDGVETIRFFSPDEMKSFGVDPALLKKPNFIPAHGALEQADLFDAAFFGFNPREAEIIDPQHRLFLETAWTALETAGYDPARYPGQIGVFGGSSVATYLHLNVLENPQVLASVGEYQARLNNLADTLANRVSYKLNLTGPAFSVQSTCSTSLVAVHVACQSLLGGTCDIALAGGVSLTMPQRRGYLYSEGMIFSPDGHCRPFDAKAKGTLAGDGAGVVVLKRLADAIADGDTIHAVVLATAANNDGADKIGYTAPSVGGQIRVIREAQNLAGIDPDSIAYIEAHGTGTALGDPIEVSALTQAFRAGTTRRGFCALGSVKSNMGHLDAAAGIAGFIKSVLVVREGALPPSLHYVSPNPQIDFESSPFYVNTQARPWPADAQPRRAGVNSFGIGGTNAHAIVESAPEPQSADAARPHHLVVLSARSAAALQNAAANLAAHLDAHPALDLADAAFTLQLGRRSFAHRMAVVGRDAAELRAALLKPDKSALAQAPSGSAGKNLRAAFLFPGQGAQYPGMGRELYDAEPLFRANVDQCADLLRPHMGFDLREAIFPRDPADPEAQRRLTQTSITQPALFTIQYALAQLWMHWGVKPAAMVGHSIAEYTAACLAGVMTLPDALALVAARGRLMQSMPPGQMLAAPLPPEKLSAHLTPELSLAVINAPAMSVAAGPADAIARLQERLAAAGIEGKILHTSHAFHSSMMQPIVEPLRRLAAGVRLQPPQIPFVSTVTGTWITPEQATDPDHWARNVREPVRFADAAGELLKRERVLLEVGPGNTLTSLARAHSAFTPAHTLVTSLRHPRETHPDQPFILRALGRLWASGVEVDWRAFHGETRRRRVPLPTYPFERSRFWVDPAPQASGARAGRARAAAPGRREDLADWFYVPAWRTAALPPASPASAPAPARCLLLGDPAGLTPRLAQRLRDAGHDVVLALPGPAFAAHPDGSFSLRPAAREDFVRLLADLASTGREPAAIFHLWNLDGSAVAPRDASFFSLLHLAQALGEALPGRKPQIKILSDRLHAVLDGDAVEPEKSLLLGPARVIPQEYAGVECANIDLPPGAAGSRAERSLLDALLHELSVERAEVPDRVIAYRGGRRFVEDFQPLRLPAVEGRPALLRDSGVYLITGGLGGIGLTLALDLARRVRARLVLASRTLPPPRDAWDRWLADHKPDDATSQRIAKLRAIEAAGGQVLLIAADAADPAAMERGVARAIETFGAIHGVIHAAGVPSDGLIQVKNPADAAAVLAAKVDGTLVLDRVLADRPLDFVVLMSSLSSLVGGAGRVDYTAANAFLDAFAHRRRATRPGATLVVNWDGWREVGMAMSSALVKELQALGDDAMAIWIGPDEGADALARVLHHAPAQALVATRDFQSARVMMAAPPGARREGAQAAAVHARAASSDFVAPANPTEEAVALIWQEVLGVERVGAGDNFFELGGHSLLALQVTTRLRERLKLEVPLKDVMDAATVRDLAEHLQTLAWAAQGKAGPPASANADPSAKAADAAADDSRDELTI